jgi:hypothetical protein
MLTPQWTLPTCKRPNLIVSSWSNVFKDVFFLLIYYVALLIQFCIIFVFNADRA